MKTNLQDVMEALVDLVPPGPAEVDPVGGELFGDPGQVLGGADLQGFFGAGTLSYQTPDGQTLSWDLDNMRVLQQEDLMLFTGTQTAVQ